ncbi:hypothetical protein GCM10029963_42930 [Micromonospora andamanensis]
MAKKIAINNGWVDRTREQEIHVNCLAIGDTWTMGVMLQYPINKGYEYGMDNCEKITEALLTQTPNPPPPHPTAPAILHFRSPKRGLCRTCGDKKCKIAGTIMGWGLAGEEGGAGGG